jgi:hypothetical protein
MSSEKKEKTPAKRYYRNSRAARWLRNKLFVGVCSKCGVPEWKLEKYNSTQFKRHQGSLLLKDQKEETDSEKS